MTNLRKIILIGALLMTAVPSLAEETHHPAEGAGDTPVTTPMPSGQPGMMAPGMMSMMGSMAAMMDPKHIEGHIAFLETELRITDAQKPSWVAFADALRANARAMGDRKEKMQGSMMTLQIAAPDSLLQRIDLHERMLVARLEGLRQIKAALQPLYEMLDDTQKRTADELLMMGPMGLM